MATITNNIVKLNTIKTLAAANAGAADQDIIIKDAGQSIVIFNSTSNAAASVTAYVKGNSPINAKDLEFVVPKNKVSALLLDTSLYADLSTGKINVDLVAGAGAVSDVTLQQISLMDSL